MTKRIGSTAALLVALVLLAGCVGGITTQTPTPRLSPPIIARPAVLRAVVDLSYPPFAGTVNGQKVGLDVDVAAAIADQLGLRLELIDATPTVGAALVRAGTADIVLGDLTVDTAVASQLAFAGTYISDGPAVFAPTGASVEVSDLSSKRVAVQKGSAAYWALLDEYGQTPLVVTASLLDAMKAVSSGNADVAAGDALTGAYMLRGLPKLKYVGQIGTATPVGVGVSESKARLETEVRKILDRLASQGVLTTLRRKWVGDLPALKSPPVDSLESSPAPSAGSAPAAETSPAP